MTSTIRQAKAAPPLFAPLEHVRAAGMRTSLFQGCAYGKDPRDGCGYLFQLQAVRVGPGDVENLRIHRFALISGSLHYLDTMTVLRGGHVQQGHVRISAAGTPYLWLGLEHYDAHNVQRGADVYRVRYLPLNVTVKRTDVAVQRVYTGTGTAMPVGCPDWTIVLRRPDTDADVYEWHREKYLLSDDCQAAAKKGERPEPWHTVTIRKATPDDNYQSSAAQGKYNADRRRAYRVTGADRVLVVNSDTPTVQADLTAQTVAALGPGAHVEPEGLCTIGGKLHVAIQTGSVAQRRIAYFPLTW